MAYVGEEFSVVEPGETDDFGFDFYKRMETGETVASAAATLTVTETEAGATADASPSSRRDGSPSIEASLITGENVLVVQRLTGCVAGNRYLLEIAATTSTGRVIKNFSHFRCVAPA